MYCREVVPVYIIEPTPLNLPDVIQVAAVALPVFATFNEPVFNDTPDPPLFEFKTLQVPPTPGAPGKFQAPDISTTWVDTPENWIVILELVLVLVDDQVAVFFK